VLLDLKPLLRIEPDPLQIADHDADYIIP